MRKIQMNIWKIIYLNCGERYEFMIDRRSYTRKIKAWKKKKNSGVNRIRTQDLWKHCTGIAEVMGSNSVQDWFFQFQALISQLFKLCV